MIRTPLRLLSLGAALVLGACDEAPPEGRESHERVVIEGRTFWLEPALDEASRIRGLSGRRSVPDDGGMLFVFPEARTRYFVMRDCLIDIDIAFLDPTGRVVATHKMTVEEAQREGESDRQYENRLKRYPSRFAAQFAIELAGGKLEELGLEVGEKVEMDIAGLKARAK